LGDCKNRRENRPEKEEIAKGEVEGFPTALEKRWKDKPNRERFMK